MLNLSLVKTLLAVVRTKSLREGADELGLSQPAVSQHIRKLEEEVGVTLIRRDRRGCEPTLAALVFLPLAENILRLSERAKKAVVRLNQLRIGAGSNIGIYILQPLLKSFWDTHPGLDLDVVVGFCCKEAFSHKSVEIMSNKFKQLNVKKKLFSIFCNRTIFCSKEA